jgi:hypothetical protein
MLERGNAHGIDTRGVIDHGFVHSIYFRDPNGYVVELAARQPENPPRTPPVRPRPRPLERSSQTGKPARPSPTSIARLRKRPAAAQRWRQT